MRYRVTMKDLQGTVARINRIVGIADPKWNVPGSYTLDGAYGGWKLAQIVNEHGGQRDITSGYASRRECYELMHAFIRGLEASQGAER